MRWPVWRCGAFWWTWPARGSPFAGAPGGTRRTVPAPQEIVEIGVLMERLEAKDPDAARMVDMHYFSGFTLEEIAQETGLTVRQVRSRWEKGMKWLKRMLQSDR